MISLNSNELLDFVVASHAMGEDQRTALATRLKYMQRLGFPLESPPGKGKLARYGFVEVLKTAIAFQLLETGASTSRAVDLTRTGWAEVCAPALAIGWNATRTGKTSLRIASFPRALIALGRSDDRLQAAAETIFVAELVRGRLTSRIGGPSRPVAISIDPALVAGGICRALATVSQVSREECDAAFRSLGSDLFGEPDPKGWRVKALSSPS